MHVLQTRLSVLWESFVYRQGFTEYSTCSLAMPPYLLCFSHQVQAAVAWYRYGCSCSPCRAYAEGLNSTFSGFGQVS